MAKSKTVSTPKPAPALDAQVQLLMITLTDVVVEMIQAKCKTITNRERRTLERGYFEPQYIKVLLDEHSRKRRDHSHSLWILWMLELWHRRYID